MRLIAVLFSLVVLCSGAAMAENSSESASQDTLPIVVFTQDWLSLAFVREFSFTLTRPEYVTADVQTATCNWNCLCEDYDETRFSRAILNLYSYSSSDPISRWEYGSTHQVLLTPGSYYFRFFIEGYCVWSDPVWGGSGTCSGTCFDDDHGGTGVRFEATSSAYADVEIVPEAINPRSHGVIPVALLGSEYLGMDEVDVSMLRFGPDEASPAHDLTDQWTYNEHLEDVNLDDFMDLMTHFRTQNAGIACGDTEATLTGSLLTGESFEGTDSIQMVGCRETRRPAIWMKDQDTAESTRGDGPVNIERE